MSFVKDFALRTFCNKFAITLNAKRQIPALHCHDFIFSNISREYKRNQKLKHQLCLDGIIIPDTVTLERVNYQNLPKSNFIFIIIH